MLTRLLHDTYFKTKSGEIGALISKSGENKLETNDYIYFVLQGSKLLPERDSYPHVAMLSADKS